MRQASKYLYCWVSLQETPPHLSLNRWDNQEEEMGNGIEHQISVLLIQINQHETD